MWHDHDIDFARWLHPAMWHVALESWQWIHQVAAPCNVICDSRMTCYAIHKNVCHIGILYLIWFPFPHITPVDMSFCTRLLNCIQIGPPSAEKNDVMSIFKMADLSHLDFRGFNNGFFEKPLCYFLQVVNRYHGCKLLSFWENHVFCILATDRQTKRRTDGQHRCTKLLSLARMAA